MDGDDNNIPNAFKKFEDNRITTLEWTAASTTRDLLIFYCPNLSPRFCFLAQSEQSMSVVCRQQFLLNDNSSYTTGSILTKLHSDPLQK